MTLKRYLRVASFGACLTLNCSLALAEAPTWQLAMSDADVREVVREVGAILDQTIILDPRVQGRITVLSSEALDREGIRRLFYSVLNAQGFANGRQSSIFIESRLVVGNEDASVLYPARIEARLRLQLTQHVPRVGQQLDVHITGTQTPQ